MRHSLLAVSDAGRHPFPVRRVSSHRKINHAFLLFYDAVHNRPVSADDAVLLQLCRNGQMGCVILADKKASRSITIDPVHNSRPHDTVDSGKAVPAVIHKRIDQRMAVMAGRRMHHHPLRLVHHKNILILIENIERNIFRQNIRLHRFRKEKTDLIAFV